jgi:predicted methyltransferase
MDSGAEFPHGTTVPWETLIEIAESEHGCFAISTDDGSATPIRAFSDATKRYYSLRATEAGPPTMLVSGIPMHRIKGTDPEKDTIEKLAALGRVSGRALDTATGLGYTALGLARAGASVVTVEWDPAAHTICRGNPWSEGLFSLPNLETRLGDSYDVVEDFPTESFAAILHDPPTMSLGGQLYSGEFYRRLYRILRKRGRLFHYIGDPDSRTGASTTTGVIKRLKEAGFVKVTPAPRAFGVTAEK